jgi:putative acetyltransferase
MIADALTLDIRTESPLTSDARALIASSQKALEAVYAADEIFTLDPEELAAPNAQFLVARVDGKAVGCIALVDMLRYGELKRLFVESAARGLGLGQRLVAEAETAARDVGLKVLRLETGPELVPAVKLYQSLGYRERERFGDYADLPCSLFMEKRLA